MPRPKTPAPIGQRIKSFRTRKKIALEQLANETGYSIDYLKQIESGEEIPPVGTLLQISRALDIDSGDLLKEQQTRDHRADAFAKRTQNYAYTTLTPKAEHKHLKAFRIQVQAGQAHKGVGYQHEGEEFVYVLKGRIEVAVGEHVNRLEEGDSLHFNSGIQHHMRNTGDTDAELLVVVYHP
ncbi:MAG: XRE family transcriptional regulator [Candidatus Zixiibacteriota bacterium]|nr:MAG: XRE family transcriptional regulator [candidate division Zixibacteria bacterium]